ncbi:putative RNA methyltransferase [Porcipelethomonas sp.]|uniref:putative RNA methyltransferase n=1 Tax=Porcipelethomonas sp. TaxID=2981675 RepID=UPI003EFAC0E0
MLYRKSLFACPVCGMSLKTDGKNYKCGKNHSFDAAKSGYVNLLMSNHMNTKNPGDNKLMVKSRSDFLDKGYYSHLLDALCDAVNEAVSENDVLLDAGCGEGYYTSGIFDFLQNKGIEINAAGIDISKYAADKAARRNQKVEFAVGSVFHIPATDGSCNVLLNIFAPFCREEFIRVIKDGGYMIMVIPGRKHLWELKNAVYDTPYENNPKPEEIDGFEFLKKYETKKEIELENSHDIASLFTMTPYFYNTSPEDKNKLENLKYLKTETEFEILIYRKKGEF